MSFNSNSDFNQTSDWSRIIASMTPDQTDTRTFADKLAKSQAAHEDLKKRREDWAYRIANAARELEYNHFPISQIIDDLLDIRSDILID